MQSKDEEMTNPKAIPLCKSENSPASLKTVIIEKYRKKIYVKIYPKFGKEGTLFEHYGKEEQRMGLFEKSKR